MKTALVLAGHGSHISPETAGLVWQHVDALRKMNIADEVTAAFWKEMPSFHTVFSSLEATDITVIPLFTAQGYFTQTVIPAEMELTGSLTQCDGRTIRYTRTLSEHPYLSQVVRQRVADAMRDQAFTSDQTAIVLVGHSTRRNPESRKATEAQAESIRQSGLAREVIAVYLDDTPAIADAYTLTSAPNLIVVPYFLANGSHTTIDVPHELGLADAQRKAVINNRHVYYTQPVGVEEDLRGAILELARNSGAPLKAEQIGLEWDSFPSANFDGLQTLLEKTVGIIGQLRVTTDHVRHVDDDQPTDCITTPDALRQRVRENPFRPLATSTDLPRGWYVPTYGDPHRILAIIETVYPAVVGSTVLDTGSLPQLIQRQTGRYQELSALDSSQRAQVVQQLCGNCIRHPCWSDGEYHHLNCPEPCDFWLSTALQSIKGNE